MLVYYYNNTISRFIGVVELSCNLLPICLLSDGSTATILFHIRSAREATETVGDDEESTERRH